MLKRHNSNRILFLPVLAVLTLVTGCEKSRETSIPGFWSIDVLQFEGYDITGCLSINVIGFSPRMGNCDLPKIGPCDGLYEDEIHGRWSFSKGDSTAYLTITTANKVFSGTHRLVFSEDKDNDVLYMQVFSDNFFMQGHRGAHIFQPQ
jgi:hypothetical protein